VAYQLNYHILLPLQQQLSWKIIVGKQVITADHNEKMSHYQQILESYKMKKMMDHLHSD
jgi:hypothetical protein